MKNSTKTALALGISAAFVTPLAGASTIIDIDVGGIESWDGAGSANNTVLEIDLASMIGLAPGSAVTITGIGWDVDITTVGLSWLSEPAALFSNGVDPGISVAPGAGDDFPCDGATVFCPMSYSSGGIVDLTDATLTDILLPGGILTIEFFEGYDDVADAVDSIWGGFLSVETLEMAPVPLPAAFPLLLTGLAGLFAARRRRVS